MRPVTNPPPDHAARAAAARAHRAALFNVVPLLGVFAAVGVYRTQQAESVWAARQALQAALFQFLTFNGALIVITLVAVAAAFAWAPSRGGGALALSVVLTALPFYAAYYLLQGGLAWRAATAVGRGEDFRYPVVGRLLGPPA
jgi:uncharacterized Tic20 family protein